MKSFIAGTNDAGVRLSRFVQSVTANFPNALLYKSFRNKRIKINGKRAEADYRLCLGDVIELYINDTFFPETTTEKNDLPPVIASCTLPQIVFEDENICVLYKPAGTLCHSDNTGDESLLEQFQYYLQQTGNYSGKKENRFAPALCNRIDRGTEGLVIGAKNYAALRDMNEIIRLNQLKKQYLCIVRGTPKNGIYTAYHKRDMATKRVTIRNAPKAEYKEIKTGVAVLESKNNFSLVKVTLYTGRTHQIRAHLAFLGYPLLGDKKYGDTALNSRYSFKNQALCSYKIEFDTIDSTNTLSYLSGKRVALQAPQIKEVFSSL